MYERVGRRLEQVVTTTALAVVVVVAMLFGGAHVTLAVAAAAVWGGLAMVLVVRGATIPRAALLWLLPIVVHVVFLLPLPMGLLAILSPRSHSLVARTMNVLGTSVSAHPLSIDPPETALSLVRLLGALALFVVVQQAVSSQSRRRWLDSLIFILTALVVIAAYAHPLLGLEGAWGMFLRRDSFLFGPMVNTNHLARLLGGLGLMTMGIGMLERPGVRRWWFLIVGTIGVASVFATSSRGAFFTIPVGAALALWLLRPPKPIRTASTIFAGPRAWWLIIAVVVAAVIPVWLAQGTWSKAMASLSTDPLHKSKLAMYPPVVDMIAAFPTGIGPGAFAVATPPWQAVGELEQGYIHTHVENDVLSVLLEHGLLGGIALLALIVACAFALWRRPPPRRAWATVPALVFLLLADLLDFYLETPMGAAVLAIAVGYLVGQLPRTNAQPIEPLAWPVKRMSLTPPQRWAVIVPATALMMLGGASAWQDSRQRIDQAFKTTTDRGALALHGLRYHPGDGHYAYELAVAAREKKDAVRALRMVELALELSPDLRGAHVEGARAFVALRKKDQGLAAYRSALTLQPTAEIYEEVLKRFRDVADRQQALPYTEGAQLVLLSRLKQEQRLAEATTLAVQLFEEMPTSNTATEAISLTAQAVVDDTTVLDDLVARALAKQLVVSSNAWLTALAAGIRVQGKATTVRASSSWSKCTDVPFAVEAGRLRAAASINDPSAASILQEARKVTRSADDVVSLDEAEAVWHEQRSEWLLALRLRESVARRNSNDVAAQLSLVNTAVLANRPDLARMAFDRAARLAPGRDDVVKAGLAIDAAKRP
jgi:O-antigen ligase/tetratricopeptide (TPR) repeat protein